MFCIGYPDLWVDYMLVLIRTWVGVLLLLMIQDKYDTDVGRLDLAKECISSSIIHLPLGLSGCFDLLDIAGRPHGNVHRELPLPVSPYHLSFLYQLVDFIIHLIRFLELRREVHPGFLASGPGKNPCSYFAESEFVSMH